ncbi:MAG: Ig-like domain-containing protein, partial [Flammeovirgaceae bacterium]|nr:Ig-like domain-containing protein [Flammeovirgaceae bacterium]MDW8288579.1 Ig-like domain-containing protein [Flammeovirgaceae bacterium]
MAKKIIRSAGLLLFVMLVSSLQAQLLLTENFSGTLSSPNQWNIGSTSATNMAIVSSELRYTSPTGTHRAYASTPLPISNMSCIDLEWTFKVRHTFASFPSSALQNTNNSRIYLASNQADLNSPLNGYFLLMRDNPQLCVQSGADASFTPILTGTANLYNSSPTFDVELKVTRTKAGVWEFFINGVSQGTVTNTTHLDASFVGMQARATASGRSFFYDNILLKVPDAFASPQIQTIDVLSSNQLRITFDENVEKPSAETPTHYIVDNAIGHPTSASRSDTNLKEVTLMFATSFTPDLINTLLVTGVKDLSGNAIPSCLPSKGTFSYDITPPSLVSVSVVGRNQIEVEFSENLKKASAETLVNYLLNNGIGTPSAASATNNVVTLTFSTNLAVGQTYLL